MRIDVKLKETNAQVRQLIFQQMGLQLRETIQDAIPNIIVKVKAIVKDALKQEPEYQSLLSGQLRAELGIADTADIDKIVDALVDTLNISTTPVIYNTSGLKGGFILEMIESNDISGIIYTNEAMVIDKLGNKLPWLEWLLLRGNQIIVRNFEVRMGPNPASRSGMAIMVESTSNWRVPMGFVGTVSDNWTTRAIDKVADKVADAIIDCVEAAV